MKKLKAKETRAQNEELQRLAKLGLLDNMHFSASAAEEAGLTEILATIDLAKRWRSEHSYTPPVSG